MSAYISPNFAVLPYRIFYMSGVQLSYLKVYIEIFHLWQANKLCFLSNKEISRRTKLSDRTIFDALNFFEKNGELKRVQKGTKRYILQPIRAIQVDEQEEDPVDNSSKSSTNNVHDCEIAHPPLSQVAVDPCEIAHHKYKNINIKTNKSFCSKSSLKAQNEKKHNWAEKKSTFVDVTKLSNSYNPDIGKFPRSDPNSEAYKKFVASNDFLRRKHAKNKLDMENNVPCRTS